MKRTEVPIAEAANFGTTSQDPVTISASPVVRPAGSVTGVSTRPAGADTSIHVTEAENGAVVRVTHETGGDWDTKTYVAEDIEGAVDVAAQALGASRRP